MMKKAQFWYGDFLVAVLILMIIGFLFVSSIKDITSRNEIIKELIIEASDISSVLMSEGYGDVDDWSEGIGTVGLMTDGRFDILKFYDFISLEDKQRVMLGTYRNVWIYLQDRNGNIIDSNKLQIGSVNDINSNNLVHVKRFVFYENDIHILGVVVWQ